MLRKVPRMKPVKHLITQIPINLTLLNFTNITETIIEMTNSLITPTETTSESFFETINLTKTGIPEQYSSNDFLTSIIQSRILTILLFSLTIFVVIGCILKLVCR